MTTSDPSPCEILEWDTRFFGFHVARVRADTLTQELASQVQVWCLQAGVRCLYFLSRADDADTVRIAEDSHFRLVDMRMTFARRLSSETRLTENPPGDSSPVRPVRSADIGALQTIARQSYLDTRFYFDLNFPRRLSDRLYETWIQRSCEGYADTVLVAELAGEPVGYISCHLDTESRAGKIGLVGVSPHAQGQGLGSQLVQGAVEWFRAQHMHTVSVATQARNCAAQRLYQRCGFLVQNVQLWYHKWYEHTGLTND